MKKKIPDVPGQLLFAWSMNPEDCRLIKLIQAGNRNGAFDALLSRHLGLLCVGLRRFRIPPDRHEEAEQAATIGLFNAAMHYDFTRESVTFATVATHWIRQAISDLFQHRAQERGVKVLSLDLDEEAGNLAEILPDHREPGPDEYAEASELRLESVLEDARRRRLISRKEMEILRLRGQGLLYDQIAVRLQRTRQRIQQICAQAIKRMQSKTALPYWMRGR